MELEKRFSEIGTLIDLGRRKGFLLYDEVNDMLPAEITAPEEISALLERISAAGILLSDQPLVLDGAKEVDNDVAAQVHKDEVGRAIRSGAVDKTTDPVLMYLREMGTHPLLDREGEVELAQLMEAGRERSVRALSSGSFSGWEPRFRSSSRAMAASGRSSRGSSRCAMSRCVLCPDPAHESEGPDSKSHCSRASESRFSWSGADCSRAR